MDIKSSDFILILQLEDIHGCPMRVSDTAEFKVRVWTNDPTHFLTFNKRDIISDDYNDRIVIDKMQMECLHSGTIIYDYDYSRWNADFSATDEKYNKVKTVVTDVYWRNVMNPDNPCNVVNYQTIEHIYDLIEKERIEREKLGYYIENEYTNKLADEVKRSTDVDIEMHKIIKENKEVCDNRTTELTTQLNDEIKRSTDADTAMLTKINDNLSATTQITSDLTGKLNDEIVRAKAKENEIANDLASEIERTNNFRQQIRDAVDQETSRATAKETLIDGKITDEIARAKTVEGDITSSLQQLKNVVKEEKQRSADKDTEHDNAITAETSRAQVKENEILTNLQTEVSRATDAETHLTSEIHDEVARAKAEEARIEGLITANTDKDNETTTAINNLSNKLTDEISRATEKEKAIDKKVDKNATDIATEITRATAKENEISKLIADNVAADAKTRNDLTAEVSRATGEEARIEGITTTNANNLTSEIARAKQVESDITSSLQQLKTSVKTKDDAHDDAINSIDAKITAEVARSTAKDDATDNRLSVIEGGSTTIGSIAHALSDAKHYTDEEVGKVKTTVTNEYTNTLQSYATKAEVDSRIESVIGTAPEALDTLGEIAEKLTSDSDAITAINGVLSGKANSADVYTKSEIDTKVTTLSNDIATETSRATNAENTLTTDLAGEISRAKAKEDEILGKANTTSSELSLETLRAKNAEGEINTTLNTVKGDVERLKTGVQSNTDSIAIINSDATVNGSIAHALSDAKHYTDDAVTKVKADLNVSVAGFETKDEVANLKATVSTKADKATTYSKTEVDEKIAGVDVSSQLVDYAKTTDVDNKIDAVKTSTNTELGKKLDKTTYATDKLTFADKTETNNAITTVTDNLTAETSRATEAENKIKSDLTAEINNKVATVTIEKDSTNDLLYHLMVDGENSGEINIPKDQFLSNVVYSSDTKVITFTFETTAGTTTTDVSISDLIDTYIAGDGLTSVDNKFSVKKDATSQAYIEVSASGVKIVGIDEALALKADKTDVTASLANKVDTTTYTTDKTNINNAITAVSDNLAAEVSRATGVEDGIKAEVALKANSADVYTASQVDEKLNVKANAADVNTSLDNKLDKTTYAVDKATYALKSDVATELDKKANVTDVTTELNKKANSSDVYTTAQVDEKVNVKANAADVYTKEQCDNSFMKMWQGSQSEYDAITSKDNNTLYIIS